MRVPFCDVSRENVALLPELLEATERVMRSGRVLYGAELEAFEHEIAAWHGVKYAVGVASGTDAVEIALRATGALGPHTVTAMTAPATMNAIEAAGDTADLVDIDPVTRNATFCSLQVHLYGLAEPARAADVEDVAHSMGATVDGRLAGTMGRCGAISFYPSKILGACGDGGVIVTNDKEIADKCRLIRHYGLDEGDIATRGQNSRLSELQAAYLRVKLPHVRRWISRRQELAWRYSTELRGNVEVPTVPNNHSHSWHVYVLQSEERDYLAAELQRKGIGTLCHYPRAIHQYSRWAHLGSPGQFPNAERLARTALSLPLYPYLSDSEQDQVIAAVKEIT